MVTVSFIDPELSGVTVRLMRSLNEEHLTDFRWMEFGGTVSYELC